MQKPIFKGLYHRRVSIQVCFQIDQESYEWGLTARSVDLKMKSTAAIDNRRVKQTMLCYFKCVAIFRGKIYPNRSVRDALRIDYLNITISWKRYVFNWNGSVHVISVKWGSWKTFKITSKRIFTSSPVRVPLKQTQNLNESFSRIQMTGHSMWKHTISSRELSRMMPIVYSKGHPSSEREVTSFSESYIPGVYFMKHT